MADKITVDKPNKELLELARSEWIWPLAFMLSMSMLGLSFPLGYILVPLILYNRFKNDRYDFIIMLTIFLGKYQLIGDNDIMIRTTAIVLVISVIAFLIYKRPLILNKLFIAIALYALGILYFAYLSDESILIQIQSGIANYLSIAYFMIPILVFANLDFDIKIFFRRLFPIALIFCAYYFIDSAIMNGSFLMPEDASQNFTKFTSYFYDLNIAPLSMNFPRRWPAGLYILLLCAYPVVHYYKLKPIHWFLVIAALMITRTFTFILGLLIAYFFIKSNGQNLLKNTLRMLVILIALYYIDGLLPQMGTTEFGAPSSALRIKSSIDQVIDVQNMEDEEDLAQLGSGRMAQALPKLALLYSLDREWIGMGFLNREQTKSDKYIIENELYTDIEHSIEVATGVEITPIQTILQIGILGLILHYAFFIYTCWAIRKLKYSIIYTSMVIGFSILGLAGFAGLILVQGTYLTALALAAVILTNKREIGGFVIHNK